MLGLPSTACVFWVISWLQLEKNFCTGQHFVDIGLRVLQIFSGGTTRIRNLEELRSLKELKKIYLVSPMVVF